MDSNKVKSIKIFLINFADNIQEGLSVPQAVHKFSIDYPEILKDEIKIILEHFYVNRNPIKDAIVKFLTGFEDSYLSEVACELYLRIGNAGELHDFLHEKMDNWNPEKN